MNFLKFSHVCGGYYEKSQRLLFLDAILIGFSFVLTIGIFLSGFMIHINASDFIVGLVNSSANWGAIASVFSFILLNKIKKTKQLLIMLFFISRFFVCGIVFLPFIIKNREILIYCTAVLVITGNLIWGIFSVGFSLWVMGLLNEETRNEYMYIRMFYIRIFFTIASLLMGFILDMMGKSFEGFLLIFSISLITSILDGIILLNVQEVPISLGGNNKSVIIDFFEPIKHKPFIMFLLFYFVFELLLNIVYSYIPVYFIKYLMLDYKIMSIYNTLFYVSMAFFTRYWGFIHIKKGVKYVFICTCILLIFEIFLYSITGRGTIFLLYIAAVASGMGFSGFTVVTFTYRYSLMPINSKSLFESWSNLFIGVSTLLAPVIGALAIKVLSVFKNYSNSLNEFKLMFFLAAVLSGLFVFAFMQRNSFEESIALENQ
ncbi:MAG: hypothetical protein N2489_05535 [Clostridia bacterium]|nr:hypothetical protein [Clostridia bacterium]